MGKRTLTLGLLALLVVLLLFFSFRSPPVLVDSARVERGLFTVAVEEEGRTRLPERYEVSVPVAGYLNRVMPEAGDEVNKGDVLFTLHPNPADPLDARSRAQAEAVLARAESALAVASAQVEAQQVQAELMDKELARIERLVEDGHMSVESLDRAEAQASIAAAALRSARFAVDVARHERENARAVLSIAGGEQGGEPMQIRAPIDGVVLKRRRQSEGRVQAGDAILSLGDLAGLQVEVDVLSPDAVRLRPGMRVELERWGGDETLSGQVRRIEPAGFTHVSALGVEEQRVWVIVDFDGPREQWQALGDEYRIAARFILREEEDVLQVPASALFREGNDWAGFVIDDGRAQRRAIVPGERSGLSVEIENGLEPGERVILHPGQEVEAGTRVDVR